MVLSYLHSGGRWVQEALAAGAAMACTSATGVIPLCLAAAEVWQRIEGQQGRGMSRLARSTIRAMATAQVTSILASEGQRRWCELAVAAPSGAQPFLEVFPQAAFVCVHRSSLEVVRSVVQANPWGMQGQGLGQYLLSYPGNSVAAVASYWARSTEDLLSFEAANPQAARRVRYEDLTAGPGALTALRTSLGLSGDGRGVMLPGPPYPAGSADPPGPSAAGPGVPLWMLPGPLRDRVNRLHAVLGYPSLEPDAGPSGDMPEQHPRGAADTRI